MVPLKKTYPSAFDKVLCDTLHRGKIMSDVTNADKELLGCIWGHKGFDKYKLDKNEKGDPKPTTLPWRSIRQLAKMNFCAIEKWNTEPFSTCSLFGVSKRSGPLARPVVDSKLNDIIASYVELNLPSVERRHHQALSYSYALEEDYVSWFCQFGLDTTAQQEFIFDYKHRKVTIKVLPQGFRPASGYAQMVTNLINKPFQDVMGYIDNSFLGAQDKHSLQALRNALKKRATFYGAVYKQQDFLPKTQITFIGAEYQLKYKLFRLDPSFVRRFIDFKETLGSLLQPHFLDTWYKLTGCLAWCGTLLMLPFCFLHPLRSWMSELESLLQGKTRIKIKIPSYALSQVVDLCTVIMSGKWFQLPTPPVRIRVGVSDASCSGAAFMSSMKGMLLGSIIDGQV